MGATFFFFINITPSRNPLALPYRHCHFSLFSSFFYYLLLSPLQSTSTSTCPLCAELLNEKALYSPIYKPPVGLFALVYLHKNLFFIPLARVGTPTPIYLTSVYF